MASYGILGKQNSSRRYVKKSRIQGWLPSGFDHVLAAALPFGFALILLSHYITH
jgi:hypothetical protein